MLISLNEISIGQLCQDKACEINENSNIVLRFFQGRFYGVILKPCARILDVIENLLKASFHIFSAL